MEVLPQYKSPEYLEFYYNTMDSVDITEEEMKQDTIYKEFMDTYNKIFEIMPYNQFLQLAAVVAISNYLNGKSESESESESEDESLIHLRSAAAAAARDKDSDIKYNRKRCLKLDILLEKMDKFRDTLQDLSENLSLSGHNDITKAADLCNQMDNIARDTHWSLKKERYKLSFSKISIHDVKINNKYPDYETESEDELDDESEDESDDESEDEGDD